MTTEQLYEQAYEAHCNQQDSEALSLLAQVMAQDNQYAPAYFLQATILQHDFENPNVEEAIPLYQQAIELNPTSKEYRLSLVDAYMRKAFELFADSEGQASYYHKAIEVCDFVTNEMESDNYPEDWIAGAYEKKGISYGTLGNYEEAIQNYNTARLMSPRYSHLLTMIAQIKAEVLHDTAGALTAHDEYVAYCEENKGVMVFENTLAEAYYYRGKFKAEQLNQKEAGLQDLAKTLEYENSDFYREEYETIKQS